MRFDSGDTRRYQSDRLHKLTPLEESADIFDDIFGGQPEGLTASSILRPRPSPATEVRSPITISERPAAAGRSPAADTGFTQLLHDLESRLGATRRGRLPVRRRL